MLGSSARAETRPCCIVTNVGGDDATFVLLTVTPEGRFAALGTAFFVDGNGTALTNSHVVYLARQNLGRYRLKLGPSRFPFTAYVHGGIERAAHLTGLPLFPSLRLGDDPSPGTAVRIVGPGLPEERIPPAPGAPWTATGTVDQVGVAPDGTPVFRVVSTNRPREGNSGSPVLDAAGHVVGMWTWNEGR